MKKMLLATALAYLLQDVLSRRLLFKQTGSGSTKEKPSPIISSFLELGRENCRCSQNLWQRKKMLLKQKPSKHS